MSDLVPWAIGAAVAGLVAFLYWAERRYPEPRPTRQRAEVGAVCAWCIHRAGDDCTNPGSPVYGQECGPACIGDLACPVREVRR